jgi:hypothetical protein
LGSECDTLARQNRASKNGELMLILLEQFYIRDNKEWLGSSKINISFQFATKDVVVDKSVGTFTGIKDNMSLPVRDIVVLPLTKIEDYLTIALNAMELDRAEGIMAKMPAILEYTKGVFGKIPLPGVSTLTNTAADAVSNIVNLAASLNEDDTIMRKVYSLIADEKRYPGFDADHYLSTGRLEIKEDGYEGKDPTRAILKIIKPVQ